jgi:DNA repair protein RadA/Sms
MKKQKVIWECEKCSYQQPRWTGSCSQCHNWNTFIELIQEKNLKPFDDLNIAEAKVQKISEINPKSFRRKSTQMQEVDRILGNGVVDGSLILVGGEPGIGKSTLLMQLSYGLATQNLKVLYVCAEESAEQTSLRAKRLNLIDENIFLLSESNFQLIKQQIEKLKPNVLILDSIQVLYKPELSSSQGSVVQVREIASECMKIAKGNSIITFLVGHVTKSGEIAGPRVLEHLVDTVLEFEGDRQQGFRMLRAVKNRFGPTDDVAIFKMREGGLKQIINPSEIFLEHRQEKIAGCATTATLEGARSFLLEVQALVTNSAFSTATRRSTGIDQNRLSLLLAVLEKRVNFQLYNCDVFVSIAGGMKIQEPAIDLAILLSIASSFKERAIQSDVIVVGEVGLAGEVRAIPRIEIRIKEAILMGFKKIIIPKRNFKGLDKKILEQIKIIGVNLVDEAISELLA